ncbi:MAG: hypothetical protein WCS37_00840 [Chloroflexota bacterium]|nr:hypothetical protein [Chloroflexota bacterium]
MLIKPVPVDETGKLIVLFPPHRSARLPKRNFNQVIVTNYNKEAHITQFKTTFAMLKGKEGA